MKQRISYIILMLFLFCACQSMSHVKGRVPGDEATAFQRVDFASLRPESQLAIALFDLAKTGHLESVPFVKVSPEGVNLKNNTDYRQFNQRDIVILDFTKTPDGAYSQSMVVESLDRFGRVDLSDDRIVYEVTYPDEREAAEYEELIIKYSEAIKGMDEALRNEIEKAVVDYQKASGLKADGIIGKRTAVSLSRKTPISHVQELSSEVFYPPEPRHRFFILPFETVAKDLNNFNKGFESLVAVEKNAIPLDKFKEVAKPQKKFVLFVFFFDRVDPTSAIQVGFSDTAKRRSEPLGQKRYAVPGEWPVLIEPFSIDKELPSGSALYVNLFQTDESKTSSFKRAHCIGTWRLK